jgi:uncharacterized iron-regulated membrane protein
MRRVLFWLHLCAGVGVGVVVLILSATGALLMYEKQIVSWADGYRVTPQAERLSPEVLLARAGAARPGARPASLTLVKEPTSPAAVGFGRDGSLFLDPYSGATLGEGSQSARAFFRSVTDWHRWLASDTTNRATGRAITGAANLVFLFIVMSGFYLWWPRSWSWSGVGNVVLFRRGLAGKARDFNWHNVIGVWSAAPLFFVVLTGVVMSYPWANDLLYRITGNEPPPRPGAPANAAPMGGPPRATQGAESSLAGVDAGWERAERQVPDWQTITLRLPASAGAPLTFAIDAARGAARPDKRSQLTVNRANGEVRFEPYASQNRGRQLRTWARWVHTGEAFGLVGQTVAGIASAGGVVLVCTGLALSWRRLMAWRKRRSAVPAVGEPAAAINGEAESV